VTTQNTHPEHGDVEETVVKHQSVSEIETSTPPSALEAAGAGATPSLAGTHNVLQQDQTVIGGATTETKASFVTPVALSEAEPTAKSVEAGPSLASSFVAEEEVRPFTEFIEEFRQAETRFGPALPGYAGSPLAPMPPSFEQQEAQSPTRSELHDESGQKSHAASIDAVQPQVEETQLSPTAESAAPVQITLPPAERPVSPLLRPASPRTRSTRHGNIRPRGEVPPTKGEPAQKAAGPPKPEVVQAAPPVTEPTPSPAEEQPRPARRYRFDRPAAATNAPAGTAATVPPSAQVRPEEHKETLVRVENGHASKEQNGEKEMPSPQQAAHLAQLPETAAPKQPLEVQEAPEAPGATASTTAAVPEKDRRRRYGQERQRGKTQAAPLAVTSAASPTPAPAAPAAEIVTEVVELVVPPQEEEHPEDLPPLEYAELQKANSRRRRRRHSNSPVSPASAASVAPMPAAVKPVTAETLPATLPMPTSPVVVPRAATPAPSSAPANQSSAITSGYTVNQMNQNREGSNPFMGPEPSPARGSLAAQHVRSIRTDVQRTPAYPVRTSEASAASVHQLANVVAHAIQTQTDRMVTELRRANQSPTNVSVSLPPFPSTERVGVFVDVANLLYSARTLRIAVDFGKLLDFLRGNRRLIRAQAYCPTSPQPGDEQMFLQAVKGLGYRITTKNYKTFSSGAKKADLDLDLCMDVVRLVDGRAVDCIVLVSGDSDFMPMLDYCSDHGVRVEVAAFDEAMSATLRQGCDLFINLAMLDEIRV
jgi:uncharacterized LabA/DUF88 family protein